jgi:ribosomal protein S18 acetylase RimI-like enzyme
MDEVLQYRAATDADKSYFEALNEACYADVVTRQFGAWETDRQRARFDVKWQEHRFLKMVVAGRVVGGVWVDEHDDYRQLREIQVHPAFQGRGIGTRVVQDVIDRSSRLGKPLRLWVLHQNMAVSLYMRLGFVIVDDTGTQYVMEYRG